MPRALDDQTAGACCSPSADQRRGGQVVESVYVPGSGMAWRTTSLFQMNSTMSAPTVAAIKPAPWSIRYQPMVWPMKVARKAPAIPSTVVRMKPLGLFGPGESSRAMIPATNPITMIQMKPDTTTSLANDGHYD